MKKLTILTLLFFIGFYANATHLTGGYITYKYLGTDGNDGERYLIRVELFRDVTSDIKFDSRLKLGIHNNDGNKTLEQSHSISMQKEELITLDLNECQQMLDTSAFMAYKGTYEQEVTLPNSSVGYHVTYIRCCRGYAANIPDGPNGEPDQGNTFYTFIPPTDVVDNSPTFNHIKPRALCKDIYTEFDFSASDKDGDSLVYKLVTPYQGGDLSKGVITSNPDPDERLMYPIPTIVYNVGFNYNDIFGTDGTSSINPKTGVLSVTSSATGSFIAAIEVESYRDGELLSTIRQDFIITSLVCPNGPNNNATLYTDKLTFDEVYLDWKHCLKDVKGFRLERKDNSNDWVQIAELSFSDLNYTDTNVEECNTYYYRVIADSSSSFEYSNVVETYVRSRMFYLIPRLNSEVIVNWEDHLANPDGHIIERTTDSSAGWNIIANETGTIHKYYDTGLTPGTKYYYRVKSYNGTDTATSKTESISTFKVGVQEVKESTITLYPNPSYNVVNLKTDEPLTGKLFIYNQAGKAVKQLDLNNETELSIDITHLKPGIYYFTTLVNGVTYRNKLVKLP